MEKIQNWLDKVQGQFDRVTILSNSLASIWIFILMIIVTANVFGTKLTTLLSWMMGEVRFNLSITGTPEIVKLSIVGIVFLQLAYTLRLGRHVRSTMILDRLGPRTKEFMDFLACLLGLILCGLIMWSSWDHMIVAWEMGEFEGEGALRVPVAPTRTIIIFGSALFGFQFFLLSVQHFLKFASLFSQKRSA